MACLNACLFADSYGPNDVPLVDAAIEKLEDRLVEAANKTKRDLTRTFPHRPGYGSDGRKIVLRMNYFKLASKGELKLHRYLVQTRNHLGADTVPKGTKCRMLQDLLNHQKFAKVIRGTDGATIIVTSGKIDLGDGEAWNGKIAVPKAGEEPFPPEQAIDSAQLQQARARNTVSYHITPNGVFDLGEMLKYLGSDKPGAHFGGAEPIIQLLNILICRVPNANTGMYDLGNNQFFPLPGNSLRIRESMPLGGGLEAIRGYYSSARPATGRILINLNVKSAAFYKDGPLGALIRDYLGRDASAADPQQLSDLGGFLYHLKVETNYLKPKDAQGRTVSAQPKKKIHTILGLADKPRFGNAIDVTFSFTQGPGGQPSIKSVAQYFRDHNGTTLMAPKEPFLMVGSKKDPSYLPIELCTVIPG